MAAQYADFRVEGCCPPSTLQAAELGRQLEAARGGGTDRAGPKLPTRRLRRKVGPAAAARAEALEVLAAFGVPDFDAWAALTADWKRLKNVRPTVEASDLGD